MQRYRVEITEIAERDLNNIELIISSWDTEYTANKVVRRIIAQIFTLEIFPYSRVVAVRCRRKIHMAHFGKYNVLYYIDRRRKVVSVIHVISAKQDYTRFLG